MKKIVALLFTVMLVFSCVVMQSACSISPVSCPSCGKARPQSETYCSYCGALLQQDNNAACTHQWVEATCEKEKYCKLCNEIDGEKAEHTFMVGKCKDCGIFYDEYCEEHYTALRAEMQTMENKLKSIEIIEEKLALLPLDYKDVAQIKEELIFVKAKTDVLSDTVYRIAMKAILAGSSQEQLEKYYVNYAKVRSAYLALKNKADDYPHWNLGYFADSWAFGGGESGLIFTVLVGLWQDSNGNYMNIVESERNALSFGSNLPNNQKSQKTYLYFIKDDLIGFVAIEDGEDSFNAYRIMEIADNYIRVFCFFNGRTYKLTKQ